MSAGGAPLLRIGTVRARNGWDAAAPGTEVGTLAIEGIALDLPAGYGGAWMDSLGFKRVLARLGIDTRLARDDRRLVTDPFILQAEGMGSLGFTMDMRGFEVPVPGQPSVAKDDPFSLVANWSVAAFTLRYTDEGLLRALLARQAARERVPERQLRDRYAQMALRTPMPGAVAGKEAPELRALREAVAAFTRDLGTIEIAIRPQKPVPMMEFMALGGRPADRVVRELNITARATPPVR